MKTFFVSSLVLAAGVLLAADLTTRSGETYKKFSIVGITHRGVTVDFADGVVNVPLSELPDDLREKYSAEVAKQRVAKQQQTDELLDKQRDKNAEPVAELRKKLQKAQKEGKTITICGKDGKIYEKCSIQRIDSQGMTLKINGVSAYIPFRITTNMLDGVLGAPSFVETTPEGLRSETSNLATTRSDCRSCRSKGLESETSNVATTRSDCRRWRSKGLENATSNVATTPNPITTVGSSVPTIYTGPRGGQYYYNSKGRKTYVRKRR